MKLMPVILAVLIMNILFAQNKATITDSVYSDSTKIDSILFSQHDSLGLKLSYPQKNLPKNIITMPKPPRTALDIDRRESSYYTTREVQDKMDRIMNRPRRDTFMPVLAMAAFAVSVAAKQLEVEKLFELKAEDYLIADAEFEILQKLWIKAPQTIDQLYLHSELQNKQTAKQLQQKISLLSDKSLIKTRGDGDKNILFFPAQKLQKVRQLFKKAIGNSDYSEEEIKQLKAFYNKLLEIDIDQAR